MSNAPLPQAVTRHLTLAYWLLVAYASLYPFRGWRFSGLPPLAFLSAEWPRYWTAFDLAINVVVYIPLGFLLALSARRWFSRWTGVLVAAVLAALTSFGFEVLQNWLPARVPTHVDLWCNALGGAAGAILAVHGDRHWFALIEQLESRLRRPGHHAGAGLTIVCLWLIAQISPETLFIATGDLRPLLWDFGIEPPALAYDPERLRLFEATAVAGQMVAIGLFVRNLLHDRQNLLPALLLFFCIAAAVRALSASVLLSPPEAFDWLTPGTAQGLLVGAILLLPLALLPSPWVAPLACVCLLAGAAAVNLMPEDPYRLHDMSAWQQGHFLNFNGLTRWLGFLWPLLAIGFLAFTRRRP